MAFPLPFRLVLAAGRLLFPFSSCGVGGPTTLLSLPLPESDYEVDVGGQIVQEASRYYADFISSLVRSCFFVFVRPHYFPSPVCVSIVGMGGVSVPVLPICVID